MPARKVKGGRALIIRWTTGMIQQTRRGHERTRVTAPMVRRGSLKAARHHGERFAPVSVNENGPTTKVHTVGGATKG